MKNIFSNDVIYMFYVSIILINVEIISSKGEIPSAYVTDIYYSWKEANEICEMIRLYDNIQFPDTYGTLSWVDAPVEYSQWVEYKDCVNVKPEFIEKHKRVQYGDQLGQCLQYCEDYDYIGLQQSNCSCLSLSEMSHNTVISGCSHKEICRGDKYAYCANGISNFNCFIIYKKVNINEQLHIGNCLKVTRAHDQNSSFRASPCNGVSKPLCTSMRSFYGHSQNWISSFSQCKPELFVSYDRYKQSQLWQEGLFWLANIRRPYINHFLVCLISQAVCLI
ncbi:uncharacterized protein LOC134684735 [Mytilus trossulus]|uniref:uncharacterized protein LOC134684735 n=1 Tax=Mytilus trossulus TaxID=6551 RepID=UPI0030064341